MQAFLLAGGLGTRLRSIVSDRPKPLAPIGNAPFLEHQLLFLKAHGVREFVFCVGYRHEQVREYFRDGGQWGVSIDYSVEEIPLGTGGALKQAEPLVRGTFLVLNGDTFFNLDIQDLLAAHTRFRAADPSCLGTLALTQVEDSSQYGSVEVSPEGVVTGFREKTGEHNPGCWISAGVYVIEPAILELIPSGRQVSLEREVFSCLDQRGSKLYAHRGEGFFVDIGTPAGYYRFQEYAEGVLP